MLHFTISKLTGKNGNGNGDRDRERSVAITVGAVVIDRGACSN